MLNGLRIESEVDEAEQLILAVASGTASREGLLAWVRRVVRTGVLV
jgi:prophage maintenance system killer protein